MDDQQLTIAVASNDATGLDATVGQHFGRCPAFTLVDVEAREIRAARVVENPFFRGHEPGQVPSFVAETGASVLLAGGIGRRAIDVFDSFGIRVSAGHATTVRHAVEAFLGGRLPNAEPCSGHGHGDGHLHGSHDCGRVQ